MYVVCRLRQTFRHSIKIIQRRSNMINSHIYFSIKYCEPFSCLRKYSKHFIVFVPKPKFRRKPAMLICAGVGKSCHEFQNFLKKRKNDLCYCLSCLSLAQVEMFMIWSFFFCFYVALKYLEVLNLFFNITTRKKGLLPELKVKVNF